MRNWPAPLDPHETRVYVARMYQELGVGETLTGTPVVAPLGDATAHGVVAATPTIVADPITGRAASAVAVTLSVDGGQEGNSRWDNAGQIYAINITADNSAGEVLQEAIALTVKQSGSPAGGWSYDPALTRTLDQVRFKIGDTEADDTLFEDAEIAWQLTATGSVLLAALACARSLHAKAAREVSISADGIRSDATSSAKGYKVLVTALEREVAEASPGNGGEPIGTPIMTGSSISEMAATAADTDRRKDRARYGMSEDDEGCYT